MPDAGLTGAGAGNLNVIAASDFVRGDGSSQIEVTVIGDEEVHSSLIAFAPKLSDHSATDGTRGAAEPGP